MEKVLWLPKQGAGHLIFMSLVVSGVWSVESGGCDDDGVDRYKEGACGTDCWVL